MNDAAASQQTGTASLAAQLLTRLEKGVKRSAAGVSPSDGSLGDDPRETHPSRDERGDERSWRVDEHNYQHMDFSAQTRYNESTQINVGRQSTQRQPFAPQKGFTLPWRKKPNCSKKQLN